ncbi:MAG TPA: MOSC and FAD-binding oxidoreductase domain-containing protein [Bryobacteraceae bacterium]|nr:MOSC and FAD-binding oxidoreductase domain-containing protein [Bryobacteraceae bacterium]
MGRLVSVNVGLPRDIKWRGETVHTGIWKQPVNGRVMARRGNIEGDGQGDLAGHGGEQRAVMVYQTDSYRYWEKYLGRQTLAVGQFGENFTVDGLPDDQVCIGDRYQIGGALFEVTQPRTTCYRVGIRMEEPEMAALLVSHHRPGFYLRVIQEGEVGAGDEITKIADGPERLTVAGIDALLYLPGHPREQLERSLRIPALSPGWKSSFHEMLDRDSAAPGNASLATSAGSPPAWRGFRSLRVAKVARESASVISLYLEQLDRSPVPAALPGQFLVLRLHIRPDLPPLVRNYSISGAADSSSYRVSIKREVNGAASSFLHDHVKAGDVLEVSAPRGAFTLKAGDGPVVLISAGIGATPVLAMLHALSRIGSAREVWWLHGARDRNEHSFGEESRGLLSALPNARTQIAYSRPGPDDRLGLDYDFPGHLNAQMIDRLGIPPIADFYLCGPPAFLRSFVEGLKGRGVSATRIHSEVFGPEEAVTPGIAPSARPPAHVPAGAPGTGPQIAFTRSALTVPWNASFQSLLELAEACDVPVRWACRTGVCHTCESALIGGEVAYQPAPLEPAAEGNVLICCSRPIGDLEIDL